MGKSRFKRAHKTHALDKRAGEVYPQGAQRPSSRAERRRAERALRAAQRDTPRDTPTS